MNDRLEQKPFKLGDVVLYAHALWNVTKVHRRKDGCYYSLALSRGEMVTAVKPSDVERISK